MNNILEEITYSDGRMDDVVKSLYTPAKLKLRARTYEGINKNLSKRRGTTTSNMFSIPNAFVIGFGLDYDEKYRNLPYVGILKEEVYM